ncbi:hypothetical protein GGR95_000925 [Sulfitobacter undariae]|uniref:Uncharacterized protein n=1 Tax=Sulfitobacter undariae TaxID=1563671 RepID=A0A7W6E613_9RHOB|nr:hypothetical protein [Sulfitobacter undariae]MBB3993297.1 hypothetical protein [Sulfitobacter undariae]
MRALDALILWTPNREPFQEMPFAGTVSITTIPEADELKAHPMSVGACDLSWRETDDSGRQDLMQRYFTQMLHRDNINEDKIYQAISSIDEFDGEHFSTDVPAGEDWK